MSPAAPSTAEVMRRLDDVLTRLDKLAMQLEEGYVRKDVQEAREAASAIQIKGLDDAVHHLGKRLDTAAEQRDRERDENDRRRSSDRRLIYSLGVSVFLGPVLVAILLHVLKAG